jgi:serine beta-lactamase-like protein LACTB
VTITVKQVMSHTAGLKDNYDIHKFRILDNVTQHVVQFNDDPLNSEPGSQFEYSSYGFQIIGAIIESVLNDTFENAINKMFKELGMSSTFAEKREKIIPHRARYYIRSTSPFIRRSLNPKNSTKVEILNALIQNELVPLVAIWPAAGLMSTVPDLLKFGNYMLNSYKGVNDTKLGTGMEIIQKKFKLKTENFH